MAVLVTGGAGYIGSVMVDVLRRRGMDVVVVDNLSRGHRQAVAADIPLEIGDVTDAEFLEGLFGRHSITAVFHFAASSLVGESMTDPGDYFRNNIDGVLSLLRTMVAFDVRSFILSSTAATYGDPKETPIPESAPSCPTNPYGESKKICEQMLSWFGRLHGIGWSALRYFNAAGAAREQGEDHDPETHIIPLALQAAAGRGPELRVFGLDYPTPDGTCIRDYIHVADLAKAHLLALDRMRPGEGQVFNLGNGQGFSVLEVLASVERVTGRKVPWAAASRRSGDPPRLVASSAKAREELGWVPDFPDLDMIVASAWSWMERHPDGYDS